MSPPPLLSVTVKERVPISVTVNMTTDAEFAVTTLDLRMKDEPRAAEGRPRPPRDVTSNRVVCQQC